MKRETFLNKLKLLKKVRIDNYEFVQDIDNVTIFYNGFLDPYIIDNGSLRVEEAWFICRRIISSFGTRDLSRPNNFFGYDHHRRYKK